MAVLTMPVPYEQYETYLKSDRFGVTLFFNPVQPQL